MVIACLICRLITIDMLSNMIAQQVLGFFDDLYLHFTSLESSMIFVTFDEQISNLLGPNDVDFYMFWNLTLRINDMTLFWAFILDELVILNSFDLGFFGDFLALIKSHTLVDITYVDFPDYLYIYKSFLFEWSDDIFSIVQPIVLFLHSNEVVSTIPSIFIDMSYVFLFLFFCSAVYFSYYGKSTNTDNLIDHDYLIASSTVEAEEEITSWDDMILGLTVLVFIFFWYFGVNLFMTIFNLPDYYLAFYLFPVLYYIIMLIPAFLAYDFGIYFVSYLRGKGDSTISIVELMYDYIAFASFYIRLVVQNVRLLLMTFTFASFHEIILIHEVNKAFLFGDESYIDAWMLDRITFPSLCFSLVCQLSTYIVYFFYELLHLLFVVTAQIIAFNAMVFWLFLFLYTMFSAELHEKFFFQKRLHHKNLSVKYLTFKNSYFIK